MTETGGRRPDGRGREDGSGPEEGRGPKDGSGPEEGRGPKDGSGLEDGRGPKDGSGLEDGRGPKDGRGREDGRGLEDGRGPEQLSFEELVSALEALTDRLATGQIGIEEATDLYEQAERLHALAAERLAQVQVRIDALGNGAPPAGRPG